MEKYTVLRLAVVPSGAKFGGRSYGFDEYYELAATARATATTRERG